MKRPVYVVLLHAPMVNRKGEEVTTAVTNLDIHDIARSSKTFGIDGYFIVNPEDEQKRLVQAILGHWQEELSHVYHPARAKALSLVRFVKTFEEACNEAAQSHGKAPYVVMPDARDLSQDFKKVWDYREMRAFLKSDFEPGRPVFIAFGTGWGIAPRFFSQVDALLAPIKGENSNYNHLSVRAAVAIVLDRLFSLE